MKSLISFPYKESAPFSRLMSQARGWLPNRGLLELQIIMNITGTQGHGVRWRESGVYTGPSFGQWQDRTKVIAPKKYARDPPSTPTNAGCGLTSINCTTTGVSRKGNLLAPPPPLSGFAARPVRTQQFHIGQHQECVTNIVLTATFIWNFLITDREHPHV